jgi:hypothetical protein
LINTELADDIKQTVNKEGAMKTVALIVVVMMVGLSAGNLYGICHCTLGDANGDWVTNGIDVGYLVNFLKGGMAPPCLYCTNYPSLPCGADANGSCSVNGIDVTYLINFLKGGPYPLECPLC